MKSASQAGSRGHSASEIDGERSSHSSHGPDRSPRHLLRVFASKGSLHLCTFGVSAFLFSLALPGLLFPPSVWLKVKLNGLPSLPTPHHVRFFCSGRQEASHRRSCAKRLENELPGSCTAVSVVTSPLSWSYVVPDGDYLKALGLRAEPDPYMHSG